MAIKLNGEAWEPCEYCGGNVDDRPFLNSEDLYISGGGERCSDSYDITLFQMLYCPNCGAKMDKEG